MQHANRSNPSARQLRQSPEDSRPLERILADVIQRSRPQVTTTPPSEPTVASPPINVDVTYTQKRNDPADFTDKSGRIVTKVWGQANSWGGIVWRVSQYRTHSDALGADKYRSFHANDLNDAMRGLYRAQRWIRQVERRRRWWWTW